MALLEQGDRAGRSRSHKALVIYNEGGNFSVGANLGLALFAANIAAWGEIENLVGRRPETYQDAEIRALPGGRRARRHGARRRLRDPAAFRTRCRPMPRPISAWSKSASGCCPAGAAARRCCSRWAADQDMPNGPMPPSTQGLRDDQHRQGREIRGRGQAICCFLRATDGITMNRYRLLADAKAKALGSAGRLQAARAARHRSPAPRARGLDMAVEGFVQAGQGDPARPGGGRRGQVCSPAATPTLPTRSSEKEILALERDAFMRLIAKAGHAGPHRAHARRPASRCATKEQRSDHDETYTAPPARHALRPARAARRGAHRNLPGTEEFTPDLIDTILEEAGKFCAGGAAADQCQRRRGRLPLRKRRRAHARRASRKPTTASRRRLGRADADPAYGGQGLPEMVAEAGRGDDLRRQSLLRAVSRPDPRRLSGAAHHGTEALKDLYLPKLVSGEWTGTMCLTEPHCGTDLGLLRTKAVPQADGSYKHHRHENLHLRRRA